MEGTPEMVRVVDHDPGRLRDGPRTLDDLDNTGGPPPRIHLVRAGLEPRQRDLHPHAANREPL